MPYSGPDDDKLPDYIQELPEADREKWVAVWNDTFESCESDDGDDCESQAFKAANGVVKESKMPNKLDKFYTMLKDFFSSTEKRAMSLDDLLYGLYDDVYERSPMAYINGFYVNDGKLFTVIADNGKLFKAGITLEGQEANLDEEWEEVVIDFTPRSGLEHEQIREIIENKNKEYTQIMRQDNGRWRWVSISCSAVLNRVGAIDSRELMNSFIHAIDAGAEYPYRDFFHLGEQFRTGQADYIAREGYLLITSGLYDEDNELAELEIAARNKDPEYWGDSIEFITAENPELVEVMDGVEIPVYNSGVLRAISTLPEKDAAALFTSQTNLEEVTRMNDREFAAFKKLFGDDEEKARAFLDRTVDPTNRQIEGDNFVARTSEEPEVEPVTETPVEPVEAVEDEVPVETEGGNEVVTELELDEASLPILRAAIFDDARIQALLETPTLLVNLAGQVENLSDQLSEKDKTIADLTARLEDVERSEAEKQEEWSQEVGEKARSKISLTYRARKDKDETPDNEVDYQTEIDTKVAKILENVPKY